MKERGLPPHIEKVIADTEALLTEEIRELTGDPELVVEYEVTKIWPDDFRGFGSNVRPRKQK